MTSDWVPMYSNVFKSAHFCETKAGPKEVFFGDEVVNECWKSGSKVSLKKGLRNDDSESNNLIEKNIIIGFRCNRREYYCLNN